MNNLVDFEYEKFYHVFNRTNNKEALFRSVDNREYFLKLMITRLIGFANIYSYALLDNHFHLSISIKSEEQISNYLNILSEKEKTFTINKYVNETITIHELIANQFSRMFNSYTQAYNKRYSRSGNLFNRPFKRVLIHNDAQFGLNQYYIHHNSRKHGVYADFMNDLWHSYHILISDEDTFLDRQYVMDWFRGKEAYVNFHDQKYLEGDFVDIFIE